MPRRTTCLLAFMLVACGGARAPLHPPNQLTALDLFLAAGAPSAVRIAFGASGPSADVLVDFTPVRARTVVCPLADVDAAIPETGTCTQISSGVRETIRGGTSIGGIAIVNLSAASAKLAKVFIEYDGRSRDVALRLPVVLAGGSGCQDEGCNPTVELTPLRNGTFSADATWSGGDGVLVVLQGSVRGRSQRATGVPYRNAAHSAGPSPRSVRAEMSAPGEYALVIRQDPDQGREGLRDVRVDAVWP